MNAAQLKQKTTELWVKAQPYIMQGWNILKLNEYYSQPIVAALVGFLLGSMR